MKNLISVFLIGILFPAVLISQQRASQLWINVSDNGAAYDTTTLFFGNWEGATYCLDSTACWQEFGICCVPPPPWPFFVRFISFQIRFNDCFSEFGTTPYCYYPFPTNAVQEDTFKIAFTNNNYPSSAWTFRWSDSATLRKVCDSAFIRYADTTTKQLYTTNMFLTDSMVIPTAEEHGVYGVTIFKYGARPGNCGGPFTDSSNSCYILGVKNRNEPLLPPEYALAQNYPNPFNPSTTIKYQVAKRSFLSLKIYNLLGEELATIVNGMQDPGYRSALWDGGKYPSGVYFYKLQAGAYSAVGKMLLMR